MKVYLVYTSYHVYYDKRIIKGFTDLEKAIDFSVDVVMEKNHKYNRDYVKQTICNRFAESRTKLFVYTDYSNEDYDEFVGIITVDVE